MEQFKIPAGYHSDLNLHDTQVAIKTVKDFFQQTLAQKLNLLRVSAPVFVAPSSGLNDNLNGVERPVSFDIKGMNENAEIVHSLAKWKRYALKKYGFSHGEGLYTDMIAIRRDEDIDNIHSIYVDQWDWEKIITREERNLEYLKSVVNRIVGAICNALDELKYEYEQLDTELCREVAFITSQELENLYPRLTPKERENIYTKEHKTVCIMQIGDVLASGQKHDGRAPDYDDWKLNCDILFWHEPLECAVEISSMGIRVDEKSLDEQLTKSGCDDRRNLPFHKMLLEGKLPLTIGGGIGQSRICMLLLGKAHVGEVQASIWDEETLEACKEAGIDLL